MTIVGGEIVFGSDYIRISIFGLLFHVVLNLLNNDITLSHGKVWCYFMCLCATIIAKTRT